MGWGHLNVSASCRGDVNEFGFAIVLPVGDEDDLGS